MIWRPIWLPIDRVALLAKASSIGLSGTADRRGARLVRGAGTADPVRGGAGPSAAELGGGRFLAAACAFSFS